MINEYIYLYLFNLFLVVLFFHDYLAIKNENKIVYYRKLTKEEKSIAAKMNDEDFINNFLPQIIQQWEKNGKTRGMSLEEYIDVYIRMENKGIHKEEIEEKIDVNELKSCSMTDGEFFNKYIIDIIDDWEKNERPNGISLYQYLCDNYKKVQEDEKCAKEFVEKVIKMSTGIIKCEWERSRNNGNNKGMSLQKFIDREYRGKKK